MKLKEKRKKESNFYAMAENSSTRYGENLLCLML